MRIGITVVDNNLVIASNPRPSFHRRRYSLVVTDESFFYGCAGEMAANNAFVYECLANSEVAAPHQLRHSR